MVLPKEYFQESAEYVFGQIAEIRKEKASFGESIVVELLPIGESVPRILFFGARAATSRRSKWQRFLKGLRAVGLDTNSEADLTGKIVKFQLIEQTGNIEGEERTWDTWKALEVIPDEATAMAAMADLAMEIEATTPEAIADEALGISAAAEPGIPDEVLAKAEALFEALSKDVVQFLAVCAASYPDYKPEDLLAAIAG